MHNAAYKALGLHWEYDFADCPTEVSARVFLQARSWRACNVTMPYKPIALEFATNASMAAQLAQGANVLVNWAGRLHADNTDGKGCVGYLVRCGVNFKGAQVAICGTGPTSLAIAHACASAGASRIALLSRSQETAQRVLDSYLLRAGEALLPDLAQAQAPDARGAMDDNGANALAPAGEAAAEDDACNGAPKCRFEACAYDTRGLTAVANSSVVIDATPLGMKPGDPAPFDTSALALGQTVLDVVYGHGETALLHAARKAGCVALDGAGMLVAQAVETVRDIAEITGYFAIPSHIDLFAIMAQAAGFDL